MGVYKEASTGAGYKVLSAVVVLYMQCTMSQAGLDPCGLLMRF